ncbi:Methionine ABC transporter ATP-binding protein [Candidatus Rhodobacter oscarellae]|uniref:Methionine ABC transporter ATP-binding protein n=1 Tax=Candidatus Rhodobacter oscarellae TaxID=1675527 RepID=A0A0J9H459_9RHOB|nr:amino acid ABC transporter ATP-binding protein [Candidatus Rhodobacter lobularis]KMW60483.1 Methionine ABC transporter ATP-binding protein [Candidatus Rhodobacter lobularis]
MIRIKDLVKTFDDSTVLDGVTLDVNAGEIVTVLGASGSGKSTLIRCINGLERPSGGTITVDGNDVTTKAGLAASRRISATVFQLFNLYPHMTALGNITLAPVEVLGKSKAEAEEQARALLAKVGLAGHADKYPQQLSGGQRQRVGICRALAMQPRYILLDEVTSALDPETTGEVLDILQKLATEATTMVFVTHEVAFARSISTRIVFMEAGKLLVDMPTEEFFAENGGLAVPRIRQFLSQIRKD